MPSQTRCSMQDIRQHSDYFGTEKISRILFRMAPPVMLA